MAEILMRAKYCCAAAADALLRSVLLLIAFTGSAKCFEPRPHPVHTQTRAAGQRVRHAAVSGWVCTATLGHKQLEVLFTAGLGCKLVLLSRGSIKMLYLSTQHAGSGSSRKHLSSLDLHVHITALSCFLLRSSSGGRQRRRAQQHRSHHAGVSGADGPGHLCRV